MTTHEPAHVLVTSLAEDKRDQLFALIDGAVVVEELTGKRPHQTALHRWAKRGIAGVRLQTVTVGRRQYSTRRWLLDWFGAVDQSRRAATGGASRA